ncbi:MAG: LysM domain-containing protein, partial [Candidatus Moranbacteria bacterium]|nr:LysM domain-containing protein [Candidatus Moranbacteria bacterium]
MSDGKQQTANQTNGSETESASVRITSEFRRLIINSFFKDFTDREKKTAWNDFAKKYNTAKTEYPDSKIDIDSILSHPKTKSSFTRKMGDYYSYTSARELLETYKKQSILSNEDTEKLLSLSKFHNIPDGAHINPLDYHNKDFDFFRAGVTKYTVKYGDTLSEIAARYKPYARPSDVSNFTALIMAESKLN